MKNIKIINMLKHSDGTVAYVEYFCYEGKKIRLLSLEHFNNRFNMDFGGVL